MKTIIITLCITFSTLSVFSQVDFVRFMNGKKVEIESLEKEGRDYLLNGEKIKASDIEIILYEGKMSANVIKIDYKKLRKANVSGSYFANRTIAGKINLFEYIIITSSSGSKDGYNYRQFFNIGDGGLQAATFKNLKPVLSKNSESFKYLKKANAGRITQKIWSYTGVGLALTGLIVAVVGVKDMVNNDYTLLIAGGSTFVGGMGFMFTAPMFNKGILKNSRKAIETYNDKF